MVGPKSQAFHMSGTALPAGGVKGDFAGAFWHLSGQHSQTTIARH